MPIISYKGKTPKIGKNVFISPTAVIIGDVTIGDNASIWYNTVVRGDLNSITIGQYTNIQDNTTIHSLGVEPTHIGDYVTVGHNVVLHSRHIGNNCVIGMGSILLGLCTMEDDSVLGAGSLVPHNVHLPKKSLIFDSPCRVKRKLQKDEIEAIHQAAINYHLLAQNYMAK